MAFPSNFRLLLASQSPRRSALLAQAGVPHQVVRSTVNEDERDGDAVSLTTNNALAKAEHALVPSNCMRPFFVLGADTVVVLKGRVLGKPSDKEQARTILEQLAGDVHVVVSGVAIRLEGGDGRARYVAGSAQTRVWFRALAAIQIERYLDTGEWHDKAGGYGIQGCGGLLVRRIEGEYSTVVGLPLGLTVGLFLNVGFDLVGRRWLS